MDLGRLLPLFAVWAMIFGPLTSWLGRQRLRQPLVWLVYGALLGPLATGLVALAPPGRCPTCDEPVQGWPSACSSCGQPFVSLIDRWMRPEGPVDSIVSVGRASWTRAAAFAGAARSGRGSAVAPSVSATASDADDDGGATTLVASGVFVTGDQRLVAGSRYALARHGDLLWVLGPVDTTPGVVRFERPLDAVEIGAVGGGLIITGQGADHGVLLLSFRSVVGLEDRRVEAALAEGQADPGPRRAAPRVGTGGQSERP